MDAAGYISDTMRGCTYVHPVDTRHMTSTRLFLMLTIYDSLTQVWALLSLIVFFYIHMLLPAVGLTSKHTVTRILPAARFRQSRTFFR